MNMKLQKAYEKYRVLKLNPLLVLIAATVLCLQIYGSWLTGHGYTNPLVQGYGEKVALAILSIREGYFPWNENNAPEYHAAKKGITHSSVLMTAGYAAASDDWGLREIIEDHNAAGRHDFMGVFTADRLLGYSLMEEMLERGLEEGEQKTALPMIGAVEEEYFSDAVFIGDSRMMGVYEYAGIEGADYLAKVSMTIYNLMDTKIVINGHNDTIREILAANHYGKIYIMVGINELGTADLDYFMNAYKAVVEEIRELQPDAFIIIQAIMHVTGRKDRTDRIFNNTNINGRNEALKELANGQDIFYIDVNEVYDDENGNLRQDMSADDVHLLANCYGLWHTFFLEHGIVYNNISIIHE